MCEFQYAFTICLPWRMIVFISIAYLFSLLSLGTGNVSYLLIKLYNCNPVNCFRIDIVSIV